VKAGAGSLEAGALAVGDAWVERVRHDLRRENRATTGGWPGTLREARAQTYAHFANEAGTRRYGLLSSAELEILVRAVYQRARDTWLACAQMDDDDEGDA
jgi:hypothetical protein